MAPCPLATQQCDGFDGRGQSMVLSTTDRPQDAPKHKAAENRKHWAHLHHGVLQKEQGKLICYT